MQRIKQAIALCVVVLMAASCGSTKGTRKIPTVHYTQYGLNPGPSQTLKKSDIDITVEVIRLSDIYTYPQLFSFDVSRFGYDRDTQRLLERMYPAGPQGKSWETPFAFAAPDAPPSESMVLPLCWVKIVNGTDHILRMKDARVYLIAQGEEPIAAYSSAEDLYKVADGFQAKANLYYLQQHNKQLIKLGDAPQIPDGFYQSLVRRGDYRLINDLGKEILPGFTYEGLLVFPSIPQVHGTARLSFYDITTRTDAAGNPTAKERFEFPLERQDVSMWYDEEAKQWRPGPPPMAVQ